MSDTKKFPLDIFLSEHETSVKEAKNGLLMIVVSGTIVCKSSSEDADGKMVCLDADTGDRFYGEEAICRRLIIE